MPKDGKLTAKDKFAIVQLSFAKGREAGKKEQERLKKKRAKAFSKQS